MPASGLVIQQIQGATVVNFRDVSILDGSSVEVIAKELYSLVDQQALRKIILDFTQVRFLSSSMIGVLLNLYKKSQAIKGRIVVCGLRSELYKVFKIMRLEHLLTFADNEHDALRALDIAPQG